LVAALPCRVTTTPFLIKSSAYFKEQFVIIVVLDMDLSSDRKVLFISGFNMGKVKDVKKIQSLKNYEKSIGTFMRDNLDSGHASNSDIKQRTTIRHVAPYMRSVRKRCEESYITRALSGVPRGTSVLNWPCGCSRLLPLLKKLGYNVTSVDSSPDAVERIRVYGGLLGENCIDDKDDFKVVDIFQTGFADDYFGAVIVNQLFLCLPEAQIRQLILKELRRICSGPIIVSFFCNTMIHELKLYEGQKTHIDGINYNFRPSRKAFTEEVLDCGLTVEKWVPRYSIFSKIACVVLVRNKSC
jgi:SAM-dependent methyltransferase